MNKTGIEIPKYEVKKVLSALSETIDWGIQLMNIPSWWKETQGEGIRLGICDTGSGETHPDLKEAINWAQNFSASNTYLDIDGHGSFTQGILGARCNQIGIIGVAPKSELYSLKVLNDDGKGEFEYLTKAIEWALANNLDIINCSLGGSGNIDDYPDLKNVIEQAYKQGICIVAASGNENKISNLPSLYPQVLAIAALDKNKNKAGFSNYGKIDFSAPGVNIYSTYKDGGYCCLSGTSFASPLIASFIALLLSKHLTKPNSKTPIREGELRVPDIIEHLKRFAIDLGASGKDTYFGWGMVRFKEIENET